MKVFKSLLSLALLCIFTGCASTGGISLVPDGTPAIILKKTQSAGYFTVDKAQFPAGRYEPEFQTAKGIYYKCPKKIVVGNAVKGSELKNGGIFIPNQDQSNQKHGMWWDNSDQMHGMLVAGLTATTKIWRLKSQIEFEYASE